jgi:predicted transcriptional regulator
MPANSKKLATIPVRVAPDIVEKLDELARVDDVPRSVVIRWCLNIGLNRKRRRARKLGQIK